MTVTLELPLEAEAIAKAQAEARNVSVEDYLQGVLSTATTYAESPPDRAAYVHALMGKFAFLGPSSLPTEKAEEIAREERRWTSK